MTPEEKEKRSEYNRRSYLKHREAILEKHKARYQENREAELQKCSDYYQAHKEQIAKRKAEWYKRRKEQEKENRIYWGKNWEQMNKILDIMCDIEDKYEMNAEERDAFDIAIQCVTTVMNRMKDNRPITWD